jgi:CRP/FNR family transcriptional regulator, cyclic AMP receptor protein
MSAVYRTPLPPPHDPVRTALAACAPLAGLPHTVVDATLEQMWMRTLAPDEAVYRAGDPGDAMFVVAAGTIAARLHSPDGGAIDMTVVRAGALFGYLELLDRGPRSADAVAVGPSRVVVISVAAATRLFASGPDLLVALTRDMARIVREQVRAAHEQAFYPVQARLARFLLAAADGAGRVRLDGSQALLAQRLGVARQTVSRALHRLVTDGLVTVDAIRQVVMIVDRPGLVAVTELRTRRGRSGVVPGLRPRDRESRDRRAPTVAGPDPAVAVQTTEKPGGNVVRPVSAASSTGPCPSAAATRAASAAASASTAGENSTSSPVAAAMSCPCTASSKVRVGR